MKNIIIGLENRYIGTRLIKWLKLVNSLCSCVEQIPKAESEEQNRIVELK